MALNIGLISDTHLPEASNVLWDQVYAAFEGADLIFHAGDVHEFWVLDELERIAPVYCARGNGEDGGGGRPVQPEDPRVKYAWLLQLEGLWVGLTHYVPVPERPPNFTLARWIERFFPEQAPDVIVSGDTHVERIATIDGILCVNPGSPMYPHNYDTQLGTVGFLRLDEGEAQASVWQLTVDGIEPFEWDAVPPWKRR
ncbi:MAG: metallophosphoesterase family protein [Pseudomonadales bacterium]|nr:metallophosphoesterase family protein [Pseudomonadales bacterium]MDP6471013.1 metallophosphoesterase family protein [Pseudomonadales bacterium]MDP6825801.1 metallophosphoesterase family protein [Pseudomonadales bacterium]MDP6970205.1 metallophosphoesterase family protein [Pseudomonadales bacterium]